MFLLILLLIIAIGMFVLGGKKFGPPNEQITIPATLKVFALIPLALAILLGVTEMVKTVDPGKVAVPVAFGHTQASMGSGLHIVMPWVTLKQFSTRQQPYTMSVQAGEGDKSGDDSIAVLGKDGGGANVDATLLFHVPVNNAGKLYKDIGTDYLGSIVRPTARKCIYDAFTQYDMVDAATTDRLQVADVIRKCIESAFESKDLALDTFQLRHISLDHDLATSVAQKVAAQQDAEKQIFKVQEAEGTARTSNINNKAIADGQQIVACGGHTETTKDSTGKDVNTVIPNGKDDCDQTQLTPAFLQYSYIQALQSLVKAPNHSTIILPGSSATPLVNLGTGG